jgi:FG-GAP repeat/FG-GAP-like repeat
MKNHFSRNLISTVIFFYVLSTGVTAGMAETGGGQSAAAQGAQAVEKLKQNGGYDSLKEALRQVRGPRKQTDNSQTPESASPQQATFIAADGAANDNFGTSVAISGDTAVIGAPHDDIGANTDQGSAYVFTRTGGTWTFNQKLTASDGAANDFFGHSVTITTENAPAQTVIMVGAYGCDIGGNPNQGAVYLFVRGSGGSSWSQQGKLTASDGTANDAFGDSVAASGGFAIFGANGVDVGPYVDSGGAYIFVRSGTAWVEEQKLTTPGGGATSRNFGWSVDISGTLAVVGSNTGTNEGWVYVFERFSGGNTWNWQEGFESGGKFGYRVAISGETFVAGSYADTVGSNTAQGSAQVYARVDGHWTYQGRLTAADGAANDTFGSSVDIAGDTIVVGADGDDIGANADQGSAYVFTRSGSIWTQQKKVIALNGVVGDLFGYSVAVSGKTIIGGSAFADIGASGQQGSASVFRFVPAQFDFDGDGKSDVSVFRPSTGVWYLQQSAAGFAGLAFGQSGDRIVPADYDGDGKTDLAVFRSGVWYIQRSQLGFIGFSFGLSTDIPAPGDFDGDGKTDIAVFRPSNGTWYVQGSAAGFYAVNFGTAGDIPVAADYDGDAKTDVAVYRPSNGTWYLQRSQIGFGALAFGTNGDRPVPADYDGDGKADAAVFRPSNGTWYLQRSLLGFTGMAFGLSTDTPVAADYDGDGKADIGVFRPSGGTWYLQRSTDGFTALSFGSSGDVAVPAAYVP